MILVSNDNVDFLSMCVAIYTTGHLVIHLGCLRFLSSSDGMVVGSLVILYVVYVGWLSQGVAAFFFFLIWLDMAEMPTFKIVAIHTPSSSVWKCASPKPWRHSMSSDMMFSNNLTGGSGRP